MKISLYQTGLLTAALLAGGCGRAVPPVASLDEAGKKLRQECADELDQHVVVRTVGGGAGDAGGGKETVWVYLPLKERILDYKSAPAMGGSAEEVSEIQSLNFVKSEYLPPEPGEETGTFRVKYDISGARKYPQDLGYSSVYTDAYRKAQRVIVGAIYRAYGDLHAMPGDVKFDDPEKQRTHQALVDAHFDRPQPPDFFVVVIADIERGIAAESIIYFDDLRQAMAIPPAITHEEYSKRYLSRLYGLAKMIGDETGHTLDLKPVTLPDFIARQIENRVKFKYTQSIFKPGEDAEAEIDAIVRRTLGYYGFEDAKTEVENLNE